MIDQALICAHSSELLRHELVQRKNTNRAYSLRAFARDLKISHSFLSRYLRGQKKVSEDLATELRCRLDWDEDRFHFFHTMVRYENAVSPELKRELSNELGRLKRQSKDYQFLVGKQFSLLSRWYFVVLKEIIALTPPPHTPARIAKKIGVPALEIEIALDKMVRAGVFEKTATGYVPIEERFQSGDTPSQVVRNFHRQMLERASLALDSQPRNERDITGITFSADSQKIAAAKLMIRNFRKDLAEFLMSGQPDSVYQFSLALFRHDHVKTKRRSVSGEKEEPC